MEEIDEGEARRKSWRESRATLREAVRDVESFDEGHLRLQEAAAMKQVSRHSRAALTGPDKTQFAPLQAALDFSAYSRAHTDAHGTDSQQDLGPELDMRDDDGPEAAPCRPTLPASLEFGNMMHSGHITKSQMQKLIGQTLRSLAVGDSIPLSLLPESVDEIERDLQGATQDTFVGPENLTRRVCGACGTSWPPQIPTCAGTTCTKNKTQKAKVITATKWKLHEQLRAFVENPASAQHALDHTLEGLSKSSLLQAKRYHYFHKIMDDLGGELEPRNMVLILHYDGFAPFAMAENHSVGYLLVQVITSANFRAKQVSVIPWFIFGGPDHLVSLEPFEDAMLADLRLCLDGFECSWPLVGTTKCVYRGQQLQLRQGPFTMRAVIGLSVSDQPAAAMIGGWAFHGAYLSCRWGGDDCAGTKLTEAELRNRPHLLVKGKVKSDKDNKRGRAKGVAVNETGDGDATRTESATVAGDVEGNGKSGATVWLADRPALEAQTCSSARNLDDLLEEIEDINAQRNKTAARQFISNLGWRRKTFVWVLQEWYGFDPILDMPPDFMHLAMGLLKDYLHVMVRMLGLIEKQCSNFPDLKKFLQTLRSCTISAYTSARRFLRALDHVGVSAASAEEMLVFLRLEGDAVFYLLIPCLEQLNASTKDHFNNVQVGWCKLRDVLCGFLDKRDKLNIVHWAAEMRQQVLEYLSHLQDAKVGHVHTFSHAYRTFTSHLLQHLASYTEEWNDVFEWWCFVFERFAGVLTKKLRGFNQNRGVDKHLGASLSMESAIWRHLSSADCAFDDVGAMPDGGAADCAGQGEHSFADRTTLGIGAGTSAQMSGRSVQLFNMFSVDGVIYAGGRTLKELKASPGRRQLIRPGRQGKKDTQRALLAVVASTREGEFYVDVVDALANPRERVTNVDHDVELSCYRIHLGQEPQPGVVIEVSVPLHDVQLSLQPASQHSRVVLLIPLPAQAANHTDPSHSPHLLIDPGSLFHMVPATEHVFRDTRDSEWRRHPLKKCILLEDQLLSARKPTDEDPLISVDLNITKQMSAVAGVVHRECDSFFVNTDGLTPMEVASVNQATQFKPNMRPRSVKGQLSLLHRELSCCGFKVMMKHVEELLPNKSDQDIMIGDIGSGYGQVRASGWHMG